MLLVLEPHPQVVVIFQIFLQEHRLLLLHAGRALFQILVDGFVPAHELDAVTVIF